MTIHENSKFYKIRMVFTRIRHGLLLYTLRNFLVRIGIDIQPYYRVQEGKEGCKEPRIKGDVEGYGIEQVGVDEIDVMDNWTHNS